MSIKKNKALVLKTLTSMVGVEEILGEGRNSHGLTIRFLFKGIEWNYGYGLSPKGEYTVEKTRSAIRHALLEKAANRIKPEDIYKGTEWKSP